jgi:predicted MFS family arabinose efflux permease
MTDGTRLTAPAPRTPGLVKTVCALGINQIISWGSFYYTIAVLGQTMQRDLGVSQTLLFGAFTLSLFLSGLAAPTAGKLIDDRGGRMVLSLGSCIGAAALVLFASASGPVTLVLASIMAGVAMAATLYDAAFASLNQFAGGSYRRAVTALTLFGGFASTVFWPLSQVLLDAIGWRQTLTVYAGLQLLVCLPLHWWLLPDHRPEAAPVEPPRSASRAAVGAAGADYAWLAAAFALVSFVSSALLIHLITLLKLGGLNAKDAVFVAALIGPMQVLGRILEFTVARNVRPVMIGTVSFVLMLLALTVLYFVQGLSPLAFLFAALFGFSNGLLTIVRGTVPAVLFGRAGYGVLLGKLARPAFIARALAPVVFSVALTTGLMRGNAILVLIACTALSVLAYQLAIKRLSKRTSGIG